jgi:hypothetical protein
LEETADNSSLEVITADEEFKLYLADLNPRPGYLQPGDPLHEPARPGLIRQLTEELGLVHTTVPVQHRGHTFDDHVFSVPYARWRQEVVLEVDSDCRWPVPYESVADESDDWLHVITQFHFKRVPRNVTDTAPLLTVTFSLRVDRTFFECGYEYEYEAPYNLSVSEQDSLCAQVEKRFCWTGVRQIRLIRFIESTGSFERVTDTFRHNFTVELVLEETADDGSHEVITAPAKFTLHIADLEPEPGYL